MSELSYIWDGIVTGDASEAPYAKDNFNQYIAGIHVAQTDDPMVIPGYLDDLEVTYTGTMGVAIKTGACLLKNYLYINDTQLSFPIAAPASGFYRYDYVVLELDVTNQTIRLNTVTGTETDDYTLLTYPTLIQTDAFWQAPLAAVFVDNGVYITIYDLHDLRQFVTTSFTQKYFSHTNLLRNSEFMYIRSGGEPEEWDTSGVFDTLAADTKLSLMSRGQSLTIQTGILYQFVYFTSKITVGDVFTLKGCFKAVTGGEDTVFYVDLLGISSTGLQNLVGLNESVSVKKMVVDDELEFSITAKITTATPLYGLAVRTYSLYGDTDVGQFILVNGYHPGPYRQVSEEYALETALVDAAWSDTAKSTGTTTIDLTADFSGLVQPETKAVLLRVRGRDSGSGAGAPYIQILGYSSSFPDVYGRLDLQGVTNDVYREITCLCPVNQPIYDAQDATPQFRIDVVATGAGTLDATVEVLAVFV